MNTILYIGASKLLLKTVESLLENPSYQFYSAANGIDGLCAMVEHSPELILVEANASKIDGFQLCSLVKGKAEYSHIPVVIVLDQDDFFERAKAEALGAEAVLCKPFGKDELLSLISAQRAKAA